MTDIADRYIAGVIDRLQEVRATEGPAIDRAAEACAESFRPTSSFSAWHGTLIASGARDVSAHRHDRRLSPDRREALITSCFTMHGATWASVDTHRSTGRRLRQGSSSTPRSTRPGRHHGSLFELLGLRCHFGLRLNRQGNGNQGHRRDLRPAFPRQPFSLLLGRRPSPSRRHPLRFDTHTSLADASIRIHRLQAASPRALSSHDDHRNRPRHRPHKGCRETGVARLAAVRDGHRE